LTPVRFATLWLLVLFTITIAFVIYRDATNRSGWVVDIADAMPWLIILALVGGPATVPVVLSRKGYLSIPQWVIFAKLGFAVSILSFVAMCLVAMNSPRGRPPDMVAGMVLGFALIVSGGASLGCVVAAGVHPRPRP